MENIINAVKDLARVSELKLKIADKEAERENVMTKIGKEVYRAYPESVAGKENLTVVVELIEQARALEEEIAILNEAIVAIKGLRKCPNCGSLVRDDMKYCCECGHKLIEERPVEEAPAEEEAPADEVPVEEPAEEPAEPAPEAEPEAPAEEPPVE